MLLWDRNVGTLKQLFGLNVAIHGLQVCLRPCHVLLRLVDDLLLVLLNVLLGAKIGDNGLWLSYLTGCSLSLSSCCEKACSSYWLLDICSWGYELKSLRTYL